MIAELDDIHERLGRDHFADRLATNVLDPDPVETEAFFSKDLAYKSLVAARYLIQHANSYKVRRRRGSQKQLATEVFVQKVGRERSLLQNAVNGYLALDGRLPAQPNPRRRAEKRLWNLALRGEPLPADLVSDPRAAAVLGRIMKDLARRLHDEEVERDAEKKRAQKKARQQARREQRGL